MEFSNFESLLEKFSLEQFGLVYDGLDGFAPAAVENFCERGRLAASCILPRPTHCSLEARDLFAFDFDEFAADLPDALSDGDLQWSAPLGVSRATRLEAIRFDCLKSWVFAPIALLISVLNICLSFCIEHRG